MTKTKKFMIFPPNCKTLNQHINYFFENISDYIHVFYYRNIPFDMSKFLHKSKFDERIRMLKYRNDGVLHELGFFKNITMWENREDLISQMVNITQIH